jgi:hypothetical protein
MLENKRIVVLPDEIIISRIYFIRNLKVMLTEIWQNYTELRQEY